jgi:KUP system potassium uptake protein
MVYPSVLLTYSGQTAYLIKHPNDHDQGFFKMIPVRVFWPMLIVATLAAIVASQGLISATFSIIKQSVALDYFPRVKLVHTSESKEGQVYSPEINYTLMVLCLAVVFGFRSSATIGDAFGMFPELYS